MSLYKTNFIAMDIGSTKIASLTADVSGMVDPKINHQVSYGIEGIRSGLITNLKKFESCLVNVIYNLDRNCDI